MASTDLIAQEVSRHDDSRRFVNDFSLQVATVNGSGSQSANTILLRSIFQMGIPVSGKNLFPSNIAGLPTWYTIRANKHGYIGRKKEIDFLIAMNQETAREDVLSLSPGAAVLYDEPMNLAVAAPRPHLLPRALRQDRGHRLPRGQAAQAGQEHDLRGRDGAPAGPRHGAGRKSAAQAVRPQAEGRRPQLGRRQSRLRLRRLHPHQEGPLPRRAHGQDRGQDHRRRQHRRRAGLACSPGSRW